VKRQTLALLCGAIAAVMAPAAAQAAHTAHHAGTGDTDVRCLLFAMNMASSQDQGAKTVGMLGMTYYMGRIDGAGHTADLEQRMEAEIAAMKGQNVAPIAQACGETLQGRMRSIAATGDQLQKKLAPQGAATTDGAEADPGAHDPLKASIAC